MQIRGGRDSIDIALDAAARENASHDRKRRSEKDESQNTPCDETGARASTDEAEALSQRPSLLTAVGFPRFPFRKGFEMKFLRGTALYVCAIALHAGAQQPKQDWLALHEAGLASCQTGHYDEALATFKIALPLAQTPQQNAMTLADIGYSLADVGRDAEAIDELEKALAAWRSIDPAGSGAAETAVGLGHMQQRIERYMQAEHTLRSALDDKPRDEASTAAVFNALGDLINQQGRFPEARQAFETALRLSTSGKESRTGARRVGRCGKVHG
jgi:tetratricopeptide (TPR) repeat protein